MPFSRAFLLSFLFLLVTSLPAQEIPIFIEEGGVVLFETDKATELGLWEEQTTVAGYTGENYLNYQGPNSYSEISPSILNYTVRITKTGTYRFQWRSRISQGTSNTDFNDSWLRLPGAAEFYAQKGASRLYPHGSGMTPNPEGAGRDGWFKVYQNVRNDWTWDAKTNDNDPYLIYVRYDTVGDYRVQVAGRSKHHAIDRVVLYHSDVSSANALRLSRPVSEYANPPVSVSDLTVERLRVSPNPVTTEVMVQLPSDIVAGTYEVSIVGSDGREFSRQPYRLSPGGTLQMPVAQLPAGHYVFHFSVPEKHYTGRFIR
jgi:hypothetical protein